MGLDDNGSRVEPIAAMDIQGLCLMLSDIMNEFQRTQGILCADEIARSLDRELSAVEGMLELLVRMGKLVEIGGQSGCEVCPESPTCLLIPAQRKAYAVFQSGGKPSTDQAVRESSTLQVKVRS